jgi:putative transposase
LTLAYLDACGFAPSLPVCYSWTARGCRKRGPCENPPGRRVNALVALVRDGPQRSLTWACERGSFLAEQVLDFLTKLPRLPGQRVVVVWDNGSVHTRRIIKDARPYLTEQGIDLYFLPASSPELNAIERVFGMVKRHEMPARRYTSWESLEVAIDTAFANYETRLQQLKARPQPRPSA